MSDKNCKFGEESIREKIGFIGAGNMAEALVKGLLKAGLTLSRQIILADVNNRRLSELQEKYGTQRAKDNIEVIRESHIVILAVKPQVMTHVLKEIAPQVDINKLLISIAAGLPLSLFRAYLGENARVVRVMPNTPALILEGATALCSDGVNKADIVKVKQIFTSVGQVVVVEEGFIDVITGLSGSGPAYLAMIIEALTDGGVLMGLPRKISHELVLQTVLGTALLLKETDSHPALLKDMVSSPGGTTIQGIYALEKGSVRASLMEAIKSATIRSQELGKAWSAEKTENK